MVMEPTWRPGAITRGLPTTLILPPGSELFCGHLMIDGQFRRVCATKNTHLWVQPSSKRVGQKFPFQKLYNQYPPRGVYK